VKTNRKSEHRTSRPPKSVRIPMEGQTLHQILRISQVCEVTAFSRAEIYRRINSATFPRPLKIGKRATGWHWGAVKAHLLALAEQT
jgi:predicted DNA-binding transcriptional regulator AlpA